MAESAAPEATIAPTVKLNNGVDMPVVGLGTFLSKNAQIFTDLVRASFDAGYRHIDTAHFYDNHALIGEALKTIFAEGKYKREDIFITTKLFALKTYNAIEILKEALQKLNLEYVDLYLVHWPVNFAPSATPDAEPTITSKPQHEIWAEMEAAYDAKLTRAIGVSNYNVQFLANLLSYAKVRPAVNQVELHPYNQQPQLRAFCKRFGIVVTAYSPLAKGGLPQAYLQNHSVDIFQDATLKAIAEKHGKSVAQVALNFLHYELGVIVIPKTERVERLPENINWVSFRLTSEEADQLRAIDKKLRILDTTKTQGFAWVDYWA